MGRPAKPLSERFLQKYRVDLAAGCWLWTDHVDEDGYGIIWVGGKKRIKRAHRVLLNCAEKQFRKILWCAIPVILGTALIPGTSTSEQISRTSPTWFDEAGRQQPSTHNRGN